MLVIQYTCEIGLKINNIKIMFQNGLLWIDFIYFHHTLCFYYLGTLGNPGENLICSDSVNDRERRKFLVHSNKTTATTVTLEM